MKKIIYINVFLIVYLLFPNGSFGQCSASIDLNQGSLMAFSPSGETLTKQVVFSGGSSCTGDVTFSNIPSNLNISYSDVTKMITASWGVNTASNRNGKIICSILSQNISFDLYVSQGSVVPTNQCSLDDFGFEDHPLYPFVRFFDAGGSQSVPVNFTGDNCSDYLSFHEVPSWLNLTHVYATSSPRIDITSQTNTTTSMRIANVIVEVPSKNIYKLLPIKQVECINYWYPDTDGDGFGDQGVAPVIDCVAPYVGAVTNNSDNCPNTYSLINNGCETNYVQPDINWTTSKSKDILGRVTSSSIAYFDGLGKNIQNQSVDIKTNKIWATQTLYDFQGRPALNTLSAPIKSTLFNYMPDFIIDENDGLYTTIDFETDIQNPMQVGKKEGTLGYYYSNLNTDETLQDITDRPYSRVIYSELNPGTVKQTIGGNKINGEWKQEYSFSMPAAQEMYYVYGYDYFETIPDIANTYEGITSILNDSNKQIAWHKATKSVVEDVHGNEAVVFTDTDGKALGAARSGIPENPSDEKQYEVLSLIGEQKYIDIHIPKGCQGTATLLGNASDYKIFDLKTELEVTAIVNAGFYRIEYTGNIIVTKNHVLTYINKTNGNIQPVASNAVGIRYNVNYYDFSLNYYNTTGHLTASLQPIGFNNACFDNLSATVSHNENLKSTFSYNSLGQLLTTASPDEGTANFKYREDGQIRFSQNSKQALVNEFSYTNYDEFGRPVESGVKVGTFDSLNADTSTVTGSKEQHFTEYDFLSDSSELSTLISNTSYHNPIFLASNVAKTYNTDESGNLISSTYYSYDLYGRVTWIVQNIQGLGVKTIDYQYDPITSQVLHVIYQKHTPSELFVYKYTYNIAQELVKVETSTDNSNFTTHADYIYYETGALKRVELADGIQGIDYVYNLAGQLKAINHPDLEASKDPGGDANDLFGMTLDYYNGDYQRTNDFSLLTTGNDQYNGNIKGITWDTDPDLANNPVQYAYNYNKNNWLTEATFNGAENTQSAAENITIDYIVDNNEIIQATNSITFLPNASITATINTVAIAQIVDQGATGFEATDYQVSNITYDANGNIQTLDRNKNTEDGSNAMDVLTYNYDPAKPNQLDHVNDAVTSSTNADDIKDQNPSNYTYNSIGQLVHNSEEGVSYTYNASGLVTEVQQDGTPRVRFYYNDKNHRIKKESILPSGITTTFYVRDAAGTPLAIYENTTLVEHTIYGASRLGVHKRQTSTNLYQLTDHLGNVRAVIAKNGSNAVALTARTDYYPGGMAMPNRQIVGGEPYRYGYQGEFAETDPETGKPAFQLRIYDPRINRWTTTDPYKQHASPYMSMGNNWVNKVDPDGGFDWFRDQDGNLKWFDNGTQGFSDSDGNTWTNTNYGDELLQFDGKNLTYSFQTGNIIDGFNLTQFNYSADSGRPIMLETDQPNQERYFFSYSKEKQLKPFEGPVPEGNYHVFKDKIQSWEKLSGWDQFKSNVGRGKWPGGTRSWGEFRFEIYPKSVDLGNGITRGNFFIHGGTFPGSAGCIDLCNQINNFVSDFVQRSQNKVHLIVHYD